MLWLTVGSLIALGLGIVFLKAIPKLAMLGVILAVVGAILTVILGVAVIRDDAKNGAKCASLDGSYGGDTCYVEGVEKDLSEVGL